MHNLKYSNIDNSKNQTRNSGNLNIYTLNFFLILAAK